MVLPPIAVGSPTFRIIPSFSLCSCIYLRFRQMSFSGLHKSINATVAGTAFAKSVANAAPAVPISSMIIKNGSRNRFSVMPPRFNNIGLTVSPCA